MPSTFRGKTGPKLLLACLAASAGHTAAQSLPPLRVDPALLGAGTLPARLAQAAPAIVPAAAPAPSAVIASPPPPVVSAPVVSTPIASASTASTPTVSAPTVNAPVASVTPLVAAGSGIVAQSLPVSPAAASRPLPVARPADPAPTPVPATTLPDTPAPRPQAPAPAAVPAPRAPVAAAESSLRPTAPLVASGILRRGDDADEPTFITADSITGINDREVVASGQVELRKRDMTMLANRITFRQQDDELEAEGNVRFLRDQDKISGPHLRIKLEEKTGFFEQPTYQIARTKIGAGETAPGRAATTPTTTGRGGARHLEFEGEGKYRLTEATYSTCQPADGQAPDWYARVADLNLDYNDETGAGKDGSIVFKGVSILYSPWLSFSLNNRRKSGLLAPTLGSSSKTGFEYTQPVYWNIAPDMDATFAPRLMSKRGLQLNGEYRYLGTRYNGQARVEHLGNDKLLRRDRNGYSFFHNHNLGAGFTGQIALNGVSDDTYFSDLSTRISAVSQNNLLRQGNLSYNGGWWQASLMAQSYQTLQDPSLPPLAVPYRRLPQLTLTAMRPDLPLGLQANLAAEHVNFRHPTQTEGRRITIYPQLSLPLQTAAFYITPKLGLHSTRYQLDRITTAGTPASINRALPIFSIDSGVTFERETEFFGNTVTQTLEPRLFYLNVPLRDQSQIPVFDTAIADFNFAQIFAENRYVGGDRLVDANQLTAVAVSRLIDPSSGIELMRGAFGQRVYFTTQHVGLPGETLRTDRQTDLLAALSGRLTQTVSADLGLQYNPRNSRTERLNISTRYQPAVGKVLNASYRYSRDVLGATQPGVGQLDFSAQWPLDNGWHAVGRYNYSTKDKRVVETLGGLEYNGGCWVGRVVVQRIATQAQTANTALFLQLELSDFSRIGSNPLELLKRNVPGYGIINQPTSDPAFAAD